MIGFFANPWSWLAMHPFMASMILIIAVAVIIAVMDWTLRGEG